MELMNNRQETTLARIDGNIVINETEGTGFVKVYTDEPANNMDIKENVNRLMNVFDMSASESAELSLYFIEKKMTKSELKNLVTHIIRHHQYRKITVGEIISQHQPNVSLVSGYHIRNIPTEKADAEYVKIMKHNGMLYYAERSRIESLSEVQKEVLRNIYRKNF